jgi:STE24 endopeptidase
LTLVLTLLAPLLFERLFNRFWPLPDEELARELRELSERARVPVRTMLVTDASRTHDEAQRIRLRPRADSRLVLFDTLLEDAPRGELRGVVAHELGHRRFGHVAQGTALAMLGAAAGVLVLWLVFEWDGLVSAAGATGPGDPRAVPLVMLGALGAGDRGPALRDVALAPLGAPGRPLRARADARRRRPWKACTGGWRWQTSPTSTRRACSTCCFFTHPTPPERIAAARGA